MARGRFGGAAAPAPALGLRRRRPHRALVLLLLVVMAAPPWLEAAAQAAPPPSGVPAPGLPATLADPLGQLLDRLARLLRDGTDLHQDLAPQDEQGVPRPQTDAAGPVAAEAAAQAAEERAAVQRGPLQPLFEESFEDPAALLDRGWSQEVVRGHRAWGVFDTANDTMLRLDGAAYEVRPPQGGGVEVAVREGRSVAAVLNAEGRYDAGLDARLVSPVLDLRHVVGASLRTDEAYDRATADPVTGAAYAEFLAAWELTLGPRSHETLHPQSFDGAYGWLLRTPPSRLERLYLGPWHNPARACDTTASEPEKLGEFGVGVGFETPALSSVGPCPPGDGFVNPLAPRYGAGMVNLTFFSDFAFSGTPGEGGAHLDGGFLEIRLVDERGVPGAWQHLLGDAVFEPRLRSDRGAGEAANPGLEAARSSGIAESAQGLPSGGPQAGATTHYNGRVQLLNHATCLGTATRRVDCAPDVPGFVRDSGGLAKHHFTLNAYIGQRVQVAWRVHSGSGGMPDDRTGWVLDAVRLEALVPGRDVAVAEVARPRPGDLVPTTVALQPEATLRNHGWLPVEDVRVTFTVEEAVASPSPEQVAAAARGDGDAALAALSASPPAAPGPPGRTLGTLPSTQPPRVVFQSATTVPALPPLGAALARSPLACTACGPGRYVLRIAAEVQADPANLSDLPADGAEDGPRGNNALALPFEVRDVAGAEVRVRVPPAAVMTDLEEPKALAVEVANLGNLALEGVLTLTARVLDPVTLQPRVDGAAILIDRRSLTAGDLPAGRTLTSFGNASGTWQSEVLWTPRAVVPGAYRVTARFESPALAAPVSGSTDAFVRATPTPYLPGDGRPAEDFERSRAPSTSWSADRLPSRNLSSLGWRCADPCIEHRPEPLPKGPVSTPTTWNATASDGPLLELSVLALLAGRGVAPGVGTPPAPQDWPAVEGVPLEDLLPPYPDGLRSAAAGATVTPTFDEKGYRVCVTPRLFSASPQVCQDQPQLMRYDTLENLTASAVEAYDGHSFVNDYYLTRPIDLRGCGAGCAPTLAFWHTGPFAWEGDPTGALPPPPGAAATGLGPPGALRNAGTQHLAENRSRAAVEVVPLDGGPPLRAEVVPTGLPGPCAPAAETCDQVAAQACAPSPVGGCAPRPPPEAVGQPVVLRAWHEPVPAWTEETLDLGAFAGRHVALVFHFQTTLGRLNVNQSRLTCAPPPPPGQPAGPDNALLCVGTGLDHWTLDNLRLRGTALATTPSDFADGAGDSWQDTEHQNWSRFRVLRDAVDANVGLPPSCFALLNGTVGTACLVEAELRGPVVAVDGRGWERFTHLAQNQRNGRPNPHYDGWFIDDTFGFLPPGSEPGTTGHSLRWGGPGQGGQHPAITAYTLASTSPLDLTRAAHPTVTFEANYSFSRGDWVFGDESAARDGAAIFLARLVPDPACVPASPACPPALDRRVMLVPEAGYTGRVRGTLEGVDDIGPPWTVPPSAPGGPAAANAFAGRSGPDPRHATWTSVRFDLLQGLGDFCLKEVGLGATVAVQSYDVATCRALGDTLVWEEGRATDRATGASYRNVTAFADDRAGRYVLEFHAQDHEPIQGEPLPGTLQTQDFGLAVDDLRVGERTLANDIGIGGFDQPAPRREVGPGEEVQVKVRVHNHGHFDQRGVVVHYNVTQHGVQVHPPPGEDPSRPVRSLPFRVPASVVVPGQRAGAAAGDVQVAFDLPWVPAEPGRYTIRAWTELASLEVGDLRVPLVDENPRNDAYVQEVEVVAVHHLRLVPAERFPDGRAVEPLVASQAEPRALRVQVENAGTLPAGLEAGRGRGLRVEVRIEDEVGREVYRRELAVDNLLPGRSLLADFGPRAWQPPGGGLFTVRFRALAEGDLTPEDDLRVVRVLVLAPLLPERDEPWTDHFAPQDPAWQDAARRHFRSGEGWSFGRGDLYPPRANASLLLEEPLDLTPYRNAVLTLRHAYDFEEGYDGGLVEVSVDGTHWERLDPLGTVDEEGALLYQGYPAHLTSASAEVADPREPVGAFTGRSEGLVTSTFRIGTADVARSAPVAFLEDDFDGAPHLQGATLPQSVGRWREVVERTPVPQGKAWWANGSLPWRPGMFTLPTQSPAVEDVTLEGTKELVFGGGGRLTVPRVDAPLVVEFDEWRGLGLAARNGIVLQHGFEVPSSAEVVLERLGTAGQVLQSLPVTPGGATPAEPYADNYRGWTRRAVVLPGSEARPLQGEPVQLAFRLHLANSNRGPVTLPSNLAAGTGGPGDTDLLSPHFGWAIASPRLWLAVSKPACDAAGFTFRDGRCVVLEDSLAYEDADDPAARARWSAGWQVANFSRGAVRPDVATLLPGAPGGDAFGEGGWRLVDAVGVVHDAPVWDAAAPAPPRSGRGQVAEAKGSGAAARLVAPLDLRAATSDVALTLDHSFKFTDLSDVVRYPPVRLQGAVSGGVVEVSRDGGHTWAALAPVVDAPRLSDGRHDLATYTEALREEGFRGVFQRGSPIQELQCRRPLHRGCWDPDDPVASGDPGHDGAAFAPQVGASAHTPLGGRDGDPEGNSEFGLGGVAFTGTTCLRGQGEDWRDPCGGSEDWRRVRFDLTPYAGTEVLLGFRAFFTTHRFTRDAHVGCPEPGADCTPAFGDDEVLVPRDFWRVDAVRVEGRVFEGQPTWLRLRAVSDDENEAYGWDVRNLTVLGDRHVRNLGLRLEAPAEGAPLAGGVLAVQARLENRGEIPLRAQGTVTVHQAGAPALRNGGLDELRRVGLGGSAFTWNPRDWSLAPASAGNHTLHAVEGTSALRLVAAGGSDAPFALTQTVRVPPGRWRLLGFADADEAAPGTTVGAGLTLRGALGLDGTPDPALRFPSRASAGTEPSNLTWQAFALPFLVEGDAAEVEVRVHADRAADASQGRFAGTLRVDHLRLEPDPDPAAPAPLRNGGFEDDLEGWTPLGPVDAGHGVRTSGVFNRFQVTFPTSAATLPPLQDNLTGEGDVFFDVPVSVANLTWVNVTVEVKGDPGGAVAAARPADDRVEVTVTGPDGQRANATSSLRAGLRINVPVVTLPVQVGGRNEVGGPLDVPGAQAVVLPLDRAFDPPPEDQVLNATSAPEALAQVAHLRRTDGLGLWQVQVAVRTTDPNLVSLHVEDHAVRVAVATAAYAARADPIAAGLASLPEGRRALVVASTGGPGVEAGVEQRVALEPGRYRFDGVLLTRGVNWSLTRDEDGPLLSLAAGDEVAQAVRADHLPRHVRGVVLYLDGVEGVGPYELALVDEHGTVLALNKAPPRTNGIVQVPLDALVPTGPATLWLRLRANEALRVQVRPEQAGDEYPGGTLGGAAVGMPADLRAVFQGPVEPLDGVQVVAVGGGAGTADGNATSNVALAASVEHQVRQILDLRGADVRRVEGVRVRVVLPAIEPASNGSAYVAVRQGEVRAQLFDLQGRSLSDEAVWGHTERRGPLATPEAARIPALATFADLRFTDALLPEGTEQVVLGLRAINFTDDRAQGGQDRRLRLTALPLPETDGRAGLLVRGAPLVSTAGCDPAAPAAPDVAPHRCLLTLNLTAARRGALVVEAAGTQAAPLRRDQPTPAPEVLVAGVRHGGVPFALDFDVPQGAGEIALRLAARGWQGDLLVDALAVRPLTPPAAPFAAAVPRDGEVTVLAGSPAAKFPTVRGASYVVRAEALALDEQGRPVDERVLGDNRAERTTGPAAGPGRLVVARVEAAPNNLDLALDQDLRLQAWVRNEGSASVSLKEVGATLRPRGGGRAVWEGDAAELTPLPEDLRFGPFEERRLTWVFRPPPTLGHGLYTFSVAVATLDNGTNVGAKPDAAEVDLYLGTNVHQQYAFDWPFTNHSSVDQLEYLPRAETFQFLHLWTSDGLWNPQFPPENICNDPNRPGAGSIIDTCAGDAPDPQGVSEAKNWMWRKTEEFHRSPWRSVTLGGDHEDGDDDFDYPLAWELCCQQTGLSDGTIFTVIRSPIVNLTGLSRPNLLFAERRQFNGIEPDGTLLARLLRPDPLPVPGGDTNWATFPEGNCLTDVAAPDWFPVERHIQGATEGFNAQRWVRRSADLAPLLDAAEAAGRAEEGWTHVQLCWLLEQPSPLYGATLIRQWDLDDIQVTPFALDWGPAQTLPVTDNVTKEYRVRLQNRGSYTDTYEVGVEDEAGLPGRVPAHWRLDLLDVHGAPLRQVRLDPGESAEVVARITIAVAPPSMARTGGFDLPLTARSLTTDLLRSTQRLHFDYTYPERANLRVAALLVNHPELPPGHPRTVDVLVHNSGVAPAREVRLVMLDKMDPLHGQVPVELRGVEGEPLPLLDLGPQETRLLTVQWTPLVPGEHNLTAILDPEDKFLEFNERDNVLARPILVPGSRYPDLRVEAEVSDDDPSLGDAVTVRVRITNQGDDPAAGVQLTVRAGVADLLPGEPPHLLDRALAPGATFALETTWRPAFAGEQVILVRARTAAGVLEPLETSDDNFALVAVRVRGEDLVLEAPEAVVVPAGEGALAEVRVRNRGEVADEYRIAVEAPVGWRTALEGLPGNGTVVLGAQAVRPLTLRIEAPPRAEAGPHLLVVRATSANGTAPAEAHVRAMVPPSFGLRVDAGSEAVLPPGVAFLPIGLRNDGNGEDTVALRARQAPEGWTVEAALVAVPSRGDAEVLLRVASPSTTPQGEYALLLEAQGGDGRRLPLPVQVRILPSERLSLRLDPLSAPPVPGQAFEARLVARNDGNLPLQADVSAHAPPGWRVSLERDVLALRPAEERTLALRAVVPSDAPARIHDLRLGARTATTTYDAVVPVRPALADLVLVALEVRPPGALPAGSVASVRADVRNDGEVDAAPGLGVWLDGVLLGYEDGGPLAPGETRRLVVQVRLPAGDHVVLAALDAGSVLGEADETNNARLLVLRATQGFPFLTTPDAGPLAALAAVALLAALRRRRA